MSKLKELAFEINDTEQELREKIHILKQKVEKLNLENKTLKEIDNQGGFEKLENMIQSISSVMLSSLKTS